MTDTAAIPATPTTALIGDALALVFTIAAARADANETQLEALRDTLVNELRVFAHSRDDTRIRARLTEIMGNDWRPSSEWQAGIDEPLGHIGREMLKRGIDAHSLFG